MSHCERCQRFPEAATGTPPPLDALRQAHFTGVIPDTSTWQLDPDCYQREMVEEIRVGLSPPIDPGLAPVELGSDICGNNLELRAVNTVEFNSECSRFR